MEKKESVVILFSGGMRSAIAAYLLKQQGYKVIGLGVNFSKLSHKTDPTNCYPINLDLAFKLAKKMDIDFYAVQADGAYEHFVLDPMVSAKMAGQASDPMLNATTLLFDLLMEKARKLSADRMSSGHKCKIRYNKLTDEYYLEQYKSMSSGPSRYLFNLSQEHLSSLFFPLADISDDKLDQIAQVAGVETENKVLRNGLSFMQNEELLEFYQKKIPLSMRGEGDIIDSELEATVGTHQGLYNYHLGMDKIIDKNQVKLDRSYTVSAFDHAKSILYVSKKYDEAAYLSCSIVRFHSYLNIDQSRPLRGLASIQGQEELVEGLIVYKNNGNTFFQFFEPYRHRLNNGLSIALYEKQSDSFLLLGGGLIVLSKADSFEKENDNDQAKKNVKPMALSF